MTLCRSHANCFHSLTCLCSTQTKLLMKKQQLLSSWLHLTNTARITNASSQVQTSLSQGQLQWKCKIATILEEQEEGHSNGRMCTQLWMFIKSTSGQEHRSIISKSNLAMEWLLVCHLSLEALVEVHETHGLFPKTNILPKSNIGQGLALIP